MEEENTQFDASDTALVRQETERYLNDHGMVPIKERREKILVHLPIAERKKMSDRVKLLDTTLKDFEVAVRTLAQVERMKYLFQLGGKSINIRHEYEPMKGNVRMPAFHSRYDHSELDAELAKIIGIHLDLDDRSIKIAMLGGWWHDLGHSAFSHTGDDLLIAEGRAPHETRTSDMISTAPDITAFLSRFFPGEDVEKVRSEVIAVTKEKGVLGKLQSLLDTLSYIIVDRAMVHSEEHEDLAAHVITDLKGYDVTEELLVFSSLESLQHVMELRAQWMGELCNKPNKRTDEATRVMLGIAIKNGIFSFEDIEIGTDDDIRHRLQIEVQKDHGMEKLLGLINHEPRLLPYFKLYNLLMGFYDTREWERYEFESNEDVQHFWSARIKTPVSSDDKIRYEQTVILKPFDYTKKQLPVLVAGEGGTQKVSVKAVNTVLNEDDKKYFVYIPKS